MRSARSDALDVHLLGCVDFQSAMFLQQRLVYEISGRDDRYGGLMICEHPPLLTVGRDGSRRHIRTTDEELRARQIPVSWLNRGGGVLAHGPGQLAVYPIIPLDRLEIGLFEYRRVLEESVVDLCDELKLATETSRSEPGVWSRCGKFAHIAVAVKHWVAYYGLYLDVCTAPALLEMVRNPGQRSRLTSMATERVQVVSMHRVREAVIRRLSDRLGYNQFHLYTGHPLLQRTRRQVHDYAEYSG